MKNTPIMFDALKAIRKARREQEIKEHGKPIIVFNVVKDKTKYSRKAKHKGMLD